jgi:hypothetical protein
MGELLNEILLRLVKPALAVLLGAICWLVAVGPLGAEPSATLGLLCWLSGAAFILLVQEGPI